MDIALLIIVILVAVVIHEVAHALALRGLGIPISEAGLGLPIPPILVFKHKRLPFALALSPWLLGAYVQPDPRYENTIERLRYSDRAWYLNAGIVVNLVTGFGLWTVHALSQGRFTTAFILFVIVAMMWRLRRQVAAYALPLAAVPALAVMAMSMAMSWTNGSTGTSFADMGSFLPNTASEVLTLAILINISLAILNAMPLYGLDNGRVVGLLIHRWLPHGAFTVYRYTGAVIVLCLVLLSIGSNLWAIATAIFN